MPSLLLQLWARRLDQHLDPRPTRATPPPSLSTIMTLLETFQSTPSLFLPSLSMPPRSASRLLSRRGLLQQHLPLAAGRRPAATTMTAPRTGCCPMATALLLYMPEVHGKPVQSTLSPSHVTYYRNTHMRSLCEHNQRRHWGKGLSWAKRRVAGRSQEDSDLDGVFQRLLMLTEPDIQRAMQLTLRRHLGPLCKYLAAPLRVICELRGSKNFLGGSCTAEYDAQRKCRFSHVSDTVYWWNE